MKEYVRETMTVKTMGKKTEQIDKYMYLGSMLKRTGKVIRQR